MLVRSLYTKIFLWFWLAIILVTSTAVISVHMLLNPEEKGARVFSKMVQSVHGEVAVEIFEKSGRAALREHLQRWHRHGGFCSFVFDEHGQEISGQSVPPGVAELADRVRSRGTTEFQHFDEVGLIAAPVFGTDGRCYVYASQLPRWPDPGPPSPFELLLSEPGIPVLILTVVIIMGGALCYALARYLTAPLHRLQEASKTLAEGNLAARAGPSVGNRWDEIGDLGRDFDHMAERIDSLVSAQRRLLQDISHELRSPLARVNVALGIARQQADPGLTSSLERIERETERLNQLIGQLLTLTRLESGTDCVHNDTVDLAHLVREVTEDADFEARSRNRRIRLARCEPSATKGSPEMLRSAVENVVRNAMWYTAEGTEVQVELHRQDDGEDATAVISVRDHGKGIPEAEISYVFRPFYRVGEARDRHTGGTGLGLSITERAVRAHGGTVRAKNAPDGGLIVEIQLPLVEP